MQRRGQHSDFAGEGLLDVYSSADFRLPDVSICESDRTCCQVTETMTGGPLLRTHRSLNVTTRLLRRAELANSTEKSCNETSNVQSPDETEPSHKSKEDTKPDKPK